jgi:hypothetical protein
MQLPLQLTGKRKPQEGAFRAYHRGWYAYVASFRTLCVTPSTEMREMIDKLHSMDLEG